MILCRSHDPWLGLLIPGSAGIPEAPPSWMQSLGWDAWQEGPPTLIFATRETATIAASRSVAEDVAEPGEAAVQLRGRHDRAAVEAYGALLADIGQMKASENRMALIGEAVTAGDEATFLALLTDHPELLADETLELLDAERASQPDTRLDLGRRLLVEARLNPGEAWRGHFKRVNDVGEELVGEADAWIDRIKAVLENPDELIVVSQAALEFAAETSAPDDFVAAALEGRALGHLRNYSGRRDEHVAAAAEDYRRVLALTSEDDPDRADRLVNAATAIAQQLGGDPRAHAREAQALLQEALDLTNEDERPELVAMLRTNLAQTLLHGARDHDADTLRRARELCDEALKYRSPERDVEDWAYTMINRGAAIERLAQLSQAERADAEAAYRAVLEHADDLSAEVVGHARLNLLTVALDNLGEDDVLDSELQASPSDEVLSAVAELAREITGNPAVPPVTRGRALRRLGQIHRTRDELDDAIAAWREAMTLLVGADLRGVRDVGWELGGVLSELGRWEEAEGAYRAALEAADLLVVGPREISDRARNAAAANRLPRWAAHAFVMRGHLEEAVVTLENGRTRELRRQLQVEDPQLIALERLAPQAVGDWRAAAATLSTGTADVERAGAALEDALARMRAVPGFERFGLGADLRTVRAAAAERAPIIYVNPAPSGTTLIRVDADGQIEARTLGVTSQDVVFRVLFGTAPPIHSVDDVSRATSYTLAAAGDPSQAEPGTPLPDIAEALDSLLPWIGGHIAKPIDELLSAYDDEGVLLIACGPLASVPLAAAPFDGDRCLLDQYVVSTTPSATAHAAALRRASAVPDPFQTLVAVADPTDDLEFARVEVRQLSIHFARSTICAGADATGPALRRYAGTATVLHLACHGYGGMIDATESGFVLADGTLEGPEVAQLPLGGVRLAVASACQSGVTEIGDLSDEAFSLGAALLGAGAACAIATLWSVNDLATAILMARFYEHLADDLTPAAALAEAQRWVRTVDDTGVDTFLSRHPLLAAEHERMAARSRARRLGTPGLSFAHPFFWAAFILLGA